MTRAEANQKMQELRASAEAKVKAYNEAFQDKKAEEYLKLDKEIADIIGEYTAIAGETVLVSRRHIALARAAAENLTAFAGEIRSVQTLEAAAVYLREALDDLGRITGERVDEKLLDEVFSSFCVGK